MAAGVERVEVSELLSRADVLSLHAPLVEGTRRLVGRTETRPKPGSSSSTRRVAASSTRKRSPNALESGHLAGAGLDVLQEEPPAVGERLLGLDSVVLTPHAGFLSVELLESVQTQAAHEVVRALRGEVPLHVVNPQAQATRRMSPLPRSTS